MDKRQELEDFEDRLAYKIAMENRRVQNEQWASLFKPSKADIELSNKILKWCGVAILIIIVMIYYAIHMPGHY